MATDYREVLRELRSEEKRLLAELEVIRGMIPGAELMAKRTNPIDTASVDSILPVVHPKVFSNMGTREAILLLMRNVKQPLMPSEITKILLEGGIQTRSTDFAGTVGSTLTQMKGDKLIDRKENGWVSLCDPMGNPPLNVPASALRDAVERTPFPQR